MTLQPVQETRPRRYVIVDLLNDLPRDISVDVRNAIQKELKMKGPNFSRLINSKMGDKRDFKTDQLRTIAKMLHCKLDALLYKPGKSVAA